MSIKFLDGDLDIFLFGFFTGIVVWGIAEFTRRVLDGDNSVARYINNDGIDYEN